MKYREKFDQAMQKDNTFVALYEAVVELREIGVSKEEILQSLENYLRIVPTESQEDIVLEVMDCLVHWTGNSDYWIE